MVQEDFDNYNVYLNKIICELWISIVKSSGLLDNTW